MGEKVGELLQEGAGLQDKGGEGDAAQVHVGAQLLEDVEDEALGLLVQRLLAVAVRVELLLVLRILGEATPEVRNGRAGPTGTHPEAGRRGRGKHT